MTWWAALLIAAAFCGGFAFGVWFVVRIFTDGKPRWMPPWW